MRFITNETRRRSSRIIRMRSNNRSIITDLIGNLHTDFKWTQAIFNIFIEQKTKKLHHFYMFYVVLNSING